LGTFYYSRLYYRRGSDIAEPFMKLNMKKVLLVHNPGAGDEDHAADTITAKLEEAGYTVRYLSTKRKSWKRDLLKDEDIIMVAGGDGTVRKVLLALNAIPYGTNIPVFIWPAGTANNIARSLEIDVPHEGNISLQKPFTDRLFHIGQIAKGSDQHFVEAVGWGLLPALIKAMDKVEEKGDREQRIRQARDMLLHICNNISYHHYDIWLDGVAYTGNYAMVEIMNIQSVGPNLQLAPHADMADRWLEVILVNAGDMPKFVSYVQHLLRGEVVACPLQVRKAKHMKLATTAYLMHIDDKVVAGEENQVFEIELLSHPLTVRCFHR
jgi:diacylglycerol kinase (ATP)